MVQQGVSKYGRRFNISRSPAGMCMEVISLEAMIDHVYIITCCTVTWGYFLVHPSQYDLVILFASPPDTSLSSWTFSMTARRRQQRRSATKAVASAPVPTLVRFVTAPSSQCRTFWTQTLIAVSCTQSVSCPGCRLSLVDTLPWLQIITRIYTTLAADYHS